MDEENDNQLPFLGVLVERRSFAFVTSIYRKHAFIGLYVSWDAFAPKSRKVNLISQLIADKISSSVIYCFNAAMV